MLLVNTVKYAHDKKLLVTLSNGSTGFFDVAKYTTKGFFSELADNQYLKRVTVDSSKMGICWPNGQDFSADTLYAELTPL